MSPTNNPTAKDDDLTQSDNPADGKDALNELINNLAREMRLGFAKIETELGAVKTELNDVKLELGTVKTKLVHVETEIVQIKADIKIIDNKLDGKVNEINNKLDGKAKEISIELDKRASIIETKIDAQGKEVSILQQRVNSSEADRSRIITGLISAALGAILALGISKLFSFEPQRNPTNRSAIEYIPEDRIVRSSMVSFNPYASNQII
jgi:chromosome segregation ATPase